MVEGTTYLVPAYIVHAISDLSAELHDVFSFEGFDGVIGVLIGQHVPVGFDGSSVLKIKMFQSGAFLWSVSGALSEEFQF